MWRPCGPRSSRGQMPRAPCRDVSVVCELLLNSSPVTRPTAERSRVGAELALDGGLPRLLGVLPRVQSRRRCLGRSCNADFPWLCSLPKTGQAAPGTDCGPLPERARLPRRRGRQQHGAGGPHPRVESGVGHRQRRGDHQAAAGAGALAEAFIFLPARGRGWWGWCGGRGVVIARASLVGPAALATGQDPPWSPCPVGPRTSPGAGPLLPVTPPWGPTNL